MCLASLLLCLSLVDTLASSEDEDEDEESSSEEAKLLGSQKLMRKCADHLLFTLLMPQTNGHYSDRVMSNLFVLWKVSDSSVLWFVCVCVCVI